MPPLKTDRERLKRALIIFLCLLGAAFALLPFGSMFCEKGDSGEGVFFDFDPYAETARISHYPAFGPAGRLLEKFFISGEGFLIIERKEEAPCGSLDETKKSRGGQRGCGGGDLLNGRFKAYRYIEKTGYEEWTSLALSKSQLESVKSIESPLPAAPDFRYESCRYHFFGWAITLLRMLFRI